jgi:NAD(P)-dependent dehydrogenase (short-subunit alcohol dehydrogenase family)
VGLDFLCCNMVVPPPRPAFFNRIRYDLELHMKSGQQPVALITGGSAGLGWAIAETMMRNGYRVVIVGRDESRMKEACQRCSSPAGSLDWYQCDVTQAAEVNRMMATIVQRHRRLDVLLNCVGTSDRGLIQNLSVERLETLMRQNVITALLCSQAAIPFLEQSCGSIVNIGWLCHRQTRAGRDDSADAIRAATTRDPCRFDQPWSYSSR